MSLPFPKDELSMPDSSIRGMARWCCLLYKAATKHWKAFGPLLGIISTNFSARSPLVLLAFTASLSSSSRHSDRSFNTFKGSKSLIRSTRCLWRIFLCSSNMPAIFKRYKFAEAMSFTWFYRADSHISTFVVLYSVTSLLRQIYKLFSPFSLQICTNKFVLKPSNHIMSHQKWENEPAVQQRNNTMVMYITSNYPQCVYIPRWQKIKGRFLQFSFKLLSSPVEDAVCISASNYGQWHWNGYKLHPSTNKSEETLEKSALRRPGRSRQLCGRVVSGWNEEKL